jgi:hypothetical protein
MRVPRRAFLTTTAMAAVAASVRTTPQFSSLAARKTIDSHHDSERPRGLCLVDLRARDHEAEWTFMGFRDALKALAVPFTETDRLSEAGASGFIIPACGLLRPNEVRAVQAILAGGATVLIELGPRLSEPRSFERSLAISRACGLRPLPRMLNLAGEANAAGAHYIDFCWPISTKVRHQSFAVAFARASDRIVARARDQALAVVQRARAGRLIVLGSPLGPALYSGDREAHEWLRAVWAN